MLKILRNKKTAKKVWITLAVIVVPAFVLWGSGSVTRSRDDQPYAGSINGKRVSLLEYRDAMSAVTNMAIIQFGDKLPEVRKFMDFEGQAWDRLVLVADARKKRITASDQDVVRTIQRYPFFERNGKFDDTIYNELLQFVFHVPARTFEEQVRQNIMLSKLFDQATAKTSITDSEVKQEYRKANEQISLYYIAALPAEFAKNIQPGAGEIEEYFAKNSLTFKQPLSFNIEYAPLAEKNLNPDQLQQKFQQIFARLNKNEDFQAVAKDFGSTVKETGLFSETDPIPGIGWAPQASTLIAKATVGEYLPPLKLDETFFIVRLTERKEPFIPEFAAVKDKVREVLVNVRALVAARQAIEQAQKKVAESNAASPASVDFDRIAQDYGLKSSSTDLFAYGSYIEGIGSSDIFWSKTKDLPHGALSGVIETPGGFYLVKIKSTVGIDEEKFKQEKAKFEEQLLAQKKATGFGNYLTELKQKTQMRAR